jgi:hypothetical protein
LGTPTLFITSPSSVVGQRRLFRRLDDDGVAAGERRADLPRHQQQRQVPRRDDADDALGLAHRIIQRALAVRRRHGEGLGGDALHRIGEHLEICGAARNVDMRGEAHRLAGVEALGGEEIVEAAVDLVGDGAEHIGALGHAHPAPRPVERGPGGAHGGVDLGLAALGHAADDAVVERAAVFPALARGPLRERAINEMRGVAAGGVEARAPGRMGVVGRHYGSPLRVGRRRTADPGGASRIGVFAGLARQVTTLRKASFIFRS